MLKKGIGLAEKELFYADITEKIIAAAMEVHSTLGPGFLESVYEEALAIEFEIQGLKFERQKEIDVFYKGRKTKTYICDFLVESVVLVELKAIRTLTAVEEAQLLNYLKATGIKVGLLMNFGSGSLRFKRFVN